MREQIPQILNLVQSSLRGAKSDALEISSLSAKSTIRQVSEVFSVTALGRSTPHTMECHVSEDASIHISLVDLQTILMNLLNNAAEATRDYLDELMGSTQKLEQLADIDEIMQQPLIQLKCKTDDKCLIITVENIGKPIPDQIGDRIFERDFTTKASGNGIGLHDVSHFVSEAKGRIHYENGQQSVTFKVSLPLKYQTDC